MSGSAPVLSEQTRGFETLGFRIAAAFYPLVGQLIVREQGGSIAGAVGDCDGDNTTETVLNRVGSGDVFATLGGDRRSFDRAQAFAVIGVLGSSEFVSGSRLWVLTDQKIWPPAGLAGQGSGGADLMMADASARVQWSALEAGEDGLGSGLDLWVWACSWAWADVDGKILSPTDGLVLSGCTPALMPTGPFDEGKIVI